MISPSYYVLVVYFFENPETLPKQADPLCIQFVNTVGWRLGQEPAEGLRDEGALARWFVKHGLIEPDAIVTEGDLRRAINLREVSYDLLLSAARESDPQPEMLAKMNRELASALKALSLASDFSWQLTGKCSVDIALVKIAFSAVGLITSPVISRLHQCEDDTCGWLFLDRSKNHSRRWCSMSDCGNQAKAKRFRERTRTLSCGVLESG